MPLTLELYGSNLKQKGHLIIDRKNLIFTYYASRSNDDEIREATFARYKLNMLFGNAIRQYNLIHLISDEKGFSETEDLRHDALEHVGKYDRRECYHSHLIFKDDLDSNVINLIFSNLKNNSSSDLLSDQCIEDILRISDSYFSDLKNSAAARQIEADYRKDKQIEFEKATEIEMTNKSSSATIHQKMASTNGLDIHTVFNEIILQLTDFLREESDLEGNTSYFTPKTKTTYKEANSQPLHNLSGGDGLPKFISIADFFPMPQIHANEPSPQPSRNQWATLFPSFTPNAAMITALNRLNGALTLDHLEQWSKIHHKSIADFTDDHAEALINLVQDENVSPLIAIQKISQFDDNQLINFLYTRRMMFDVD